MATLREQVEALERYQIQRATLRPVPHGDWINRTDALALIPEGAVLVTEATLMTAMQSVANDHPGDLIVAYRLGEMTFGDVVAAIIAQIKRAE